MRRYLTLTAALTVLLAGCSLNTGGPDTVSASRNSATRTPITHTPQTTVPETTTTTGSTTTTAPQSLTEADVLAAIGEVVVWCTSRTTIINGYVTEFATLIDTLEATAVAGGFADNEGALYDAQLSLLGSPTGAAFSAAAEEIDEIITRTGLDSAEPPVGGAVTTSTYVALTDLFISPTQIYMESSGMLDRYLSDLRDTIGSDPAAIKELREGSVNESLETLRGHAVRFTNACTTLAAGN